MKYEVDGMIFATEEEAIKYCAEEDISPANIEEIEEEGIETEDTSVPLEEGSVSEQDLAILEASEKIVDAYMNNELSPTIEKMLLSRLMSMTQDKSVNRNSSKKVFKEQSTTATAIEDHYRSVLDDLMDSEKIACPKCGVLWSTIEENIKENLSFGDQHEELQGKFPIIRLIHVKAKHKAIFSLIRQAFGKSADEIKDLRESTVPNPESCSELESLSKSELIEKINADEELRHQFFRKWMLKLQGKEE